MSTGFAATAVSIIFLCTPAHAQAPTGAPPQQIDFIKVVQTTRELYGQTTNDMVKGGARPLRARALCSIVPEPSVEGWVGKIHRHTIIRDGWGVLSIIIGPDVYVHTWNDTMSDVMHLTLIEPHSRLFSSASALKKDDDVVFSGRFFQSDVDCIHELRMTLAGSMRAPAFIMRFTSVAKR